MKSPNWTKPNLEIGIGDWYLDKGLALGLWLSANLWPLQLFLEESYFIKKIIIKYNRSDQGVRIRKGIIQCVLLFLMWRTRSTCEKRSTHWTQLQKVQQRNYHITTFCNLEMQFITCLETVSHIWIRVISWNHQRPWYIFDLISKYESWNWCWNLHGIKGNGQMVTFSSFRFPDAKRLGGNQLVSIIWVVWSMLLVKLWLCIQSSYMQFTPG